MNRSEPLSHDEPDCLIGNRGYDITKGTHLDNVTEQCLRYCVRQNQPFLRTMDSLPSRKMARSAGSHTLG